MLIILTPGIKDIKCGLLESSVHNWANKLEHYF